MRFAGTSQMGGARRAGGTGEGEVRAAGKGRAGAPSPRGASAPPANSLRCGGTHIASSGTRGGMEEAPGVARTPGALRRASRPVAGAGRAAGPACRPGCLPDSQSPRRRPTSRMGVVDDHARQVSTTLLQRVLPEHRGGAPGSRGGSPGSFPRAGYRGAHTRGLSRRDPGRSGAARSRTPSAAVGGRRRSSRRRPR